MNFTLQVYTKESDDNQREYSVILDQKGRVSKYTITVDETYIERMTDGSVSPETFILASFNFLLSKEDSSHILPEFDLEDICRFYPEFEDEIGKLIRNERKLI